MGLHAGWHYARSHGFPVPRRDHRREQHYGAAQLGRREDVDPVDVFNYGDDVEGLFVHELGHAAIGLEHPRWAGENPDQRVMYVGDFTREDDPFCCQSINRQLHTDDIAAAQYVYGIRGDYNRDAEVSAADYAMWRKLNGQTTIAGTNADGDIDGNINATDHDAWQQNFGNVALEGFGEQLSMFAGSAVPEPGAYTMLITLAALTLALRVDRRLPV